MYESLAALNERPAPFSAYTADALWTDNHVSARMLEFHLDPEGGAASRPFAAIDGIVAWIDARLGLAGKAVCDLGCGPGLYAERMARRGARVTGIDFSARSIEHARESSKQAGLDIAYRIADYLKGPLPEAQDAVFLIYCDYCALSPEHRRLLLEKIRSALKPGGVLVLDVFSVQQFRRLEAKAVYSRRLMDGFWAAGDYFGFLTTFLYEAEALALDRYRIVEPGRTRDIFNWLQYFTSETAATEIEAAGFAVEATLDVLTGVEWAQSAREFAMVARRP